MIADMKKLLLFGNNKEKSSLIKVLHKMGCVEVSIAEKLEKTSYIQDEKTLNEYTSKLTQLDFCFSFLKNIKREAESLAKAKKIEYTPFKIGGMLTPRPELTFDEFEKSYELTDEVFSKIEILEKLNIERINLKAEVQKSKSLLSQLEAYRKVDVAFSKIKDTKHVSIMLGTINPSKLQDLSKLEELGAHVEVCQNANNVALAVFVLKEKYDEVSQLLSEMDFSNCSFNFSEVPIDLIKEKENYIKQLNEREIEIIKEAIALESIIPNARRLYDYYTLEAKKKEMETRTASTQTSYFLEAWVPSDKADELDQRLNDSSLILSYILRDPIEGEIVPTYVIGNQITTPYQSVTNMFSAPAYKEIDPNPFVTFFFFLFFGMMLSDAGYGLILTVLGIVVLACSKPKMHQSSLIKIVLMGGISTILWGIAFGSYFGVSASDLSETFGFKVWCWFNPVEEPIKLMFLSVGMGLFQMLFGIGIHVYDLIKQKKIMEGISNTCWFFLIIGIALFALSTSLGASIFKNGTPSWLKTVGIVVILVGVLLLLLAGTFGKVGAKKVTGALGNLYEVINFFSDLMSYTRIFGLGLATAVIGMVFNEISAVIMGLVPIKAIGILAAIVILLIGHIFNVAINALGAYVHNSRLQFVEFFGKFYTGGGTIFKPLGSEIKYYDIKPQEVNK